MTAGNGDEGMISQPVNQQIIWLLSLVRLTSRRAGWAIYHIRLLIFSDRSFSSIFYVIVYGVVPSCVLCLYVLF